AQRPLTYPLTIDAISSGGVVSGERPGGTLAAVNVRLSGTVPVRSQPPVWPKSVQKPPSFVGATQSVAPSIVATLRVSPGRTPVAMPGGAPTSSSLKSRQRRAAGLAVLV